MKKWVTASTCLGIFSLLSWAGPTLVTGTAATVNNKLISIRDAYFYRAVRRFAEGNPDPLQREEGDALRSTVFKMCLEQMIALESKGQPWEKENSAVREAEHAIEAQKNKGKSAVWQEILKRYGKGEAYAVERLASSIRSEQILGKKTETLTPIITEAEAEKYFRQNQSKYIGVTFDSVKDDIRQQLREERKNKGLDEWIHSLHEKYSMQMLLPSKED